MENKSEGCGANQSPLSQTHYWSNVFVQLCQSQQYGVKMPRQVETRHLYKEHEI